MAEGRNPKELRFNMTAIMTDIAVHPDVTEMMNHQSKFQSDSSEQTKAKDTTKHGQHQSTNENVFIPSVTTSPGTRLERQPPLGTNSLRSNEDALHIRTVCCYYCGFKRIHIDADLVQEHAQCSPRCGHIHRSITDGSGSRHPEYADEASRRESFARAPPVFHENSEAFIEAGLFYGG